MNFMKRKKKSTSHRLLLRYHVYNKYQSGSNLKSGNRVEVLGLSWYVGKGKGKGKGSINRINKGKVIDISYKRVLVYS